MVFKNLDSFVHLLLLGIVCGSIRKPTTLANNILAVFSFIFLQIQGLFPLPSLSSDHIWSHMDCQNWYGGLLPSVKLGGVERAV